MRTPLFIVLLATAAAAALGAAASREAFMPRLVRLEAAEAVPEMAPLLDGEAVTLSAVMLQYAADTELRLNAHLALLRHPALTRLVLPVYGAEPEFRDVLRAYGPAVMPPVAYFMTHEVPSLRLMQATGEALAGARRTAMRILGAATGNTAPGGEEPAPDLDPVQRGWYAIAFIRDEGHDFLGQFVVSVDGRVDWVQTERITEAASAFFTSGIRSLETRLRLDQEPDVTDWLWAGVDVALAAGTVKVLRLASAAGKGARAATPSARAALAGRTVARAARGALRAGRYAAPVAVAYAVVRHPSLISGLAAQAASLMGWPVSVVQGAAWFLVLLPALILANLLVRWLVRPALVGLRAAARGAAWLDQRIRPPVPHPPEPEQRIEPRLGDVSRAVGAMDRDTLDP